MKGEKSRTILAIIILCGFLINAFVIAPAAKGWSEEIRYMFGLETAPDQSLDLTGLPLLQPYVEEPTDIPAPATLPSGPATDNRQEPKPISQPTAYLTFDDGPSATITPLVLDILREHQIKATFFVLGCQVDRYPEILQQIVADGHAIGNHTYSHGIRSVYSSPSSLLAEITACEESIYSTVNIRPRIFRCPGGSAPRLTQEMAELLRSHGYIHHDWNVSTGDAMRGSPLPPDRLAALALRGAQNKNSAIILMHDSHYKKNTAAALPEIIKGLQEKGFVFAAIDENTVPVQFVK